MFKIMWLAADPMAMLYWEKAVRQCMWTSWTTVI